MPLTYADVFSVTFGLRSYNPRLGRWINRDPIGEEGGENLTVFVGNSSIIVWDLLGMRGYSPSEFGLKDKCWTCEADDDWVLRSLTAVRFVSKKPDSKSITKTSIFTVNAISVDTRKDGSVKGTDSGGLVAFAKVEVTYSFYAVGIYSYFEAVYCIPKWPVSIFQGNKRFKGDLLGKKHFDISLRDRKEYRLSATAFPSSSANTMALAQRKANTFQNWELPDWKGNMDDLINKNKKEEEEIRVRKPESFK